MNKTTEFGVNQSVINDTITSNRTSETTPDTSQELPQALLDTILKILTCIIFLVSVLGIPSNILTILVYAKLKFSETIYISYAALAVSDIGVVIFAVCFMIMQLSVFSPEVFSTTNPVNKLVEILFARFAIAFMRYTGLITAWISLERLMCVLFPMKVKMVMTRRLTKIMLSVVLLGSIQPVVVHYLLHYIQWKMQSSENKTDYNELCLKASAPTSYFNVLYGAIYPCIYYMTTTVSATLLIVKLRQSSQWRLRNASTSRYETDNGPEIPRKESRIIKTVIVITITFIVCSLPLAVSLILSEVLPQYSFVGPNHRLALTVNVVGFLSSEINSSINIFVFSFMGTKFREALVNTSKIMCKCRRNR